MKKILNPNKILAHPERIHEWLEGENPPPICIDLDLTNRCNNNCRGCIGMRKPLVDLENPQNIIRDIAQFGIKSIIFTGGGEPTLHQEFVESVQLADSLGIDVGITTNGLIVDKKMARAIKPHAIWIRYSFTGDTPELYEQIHQTSGTFETIHQNIRDMVKVPGKATIGIGYLTGKDTAHGIVGAARNAKRLGVDYFQIRPFVFDYTPIDEQLEEARKLEDDNFKILSSIHRYKDRLQAYSYGKCYGQQFHCVIAATGDVYICCNLRGISKYRFGNIKKQSLKEIWNSEKRKRVVESIDFRDCKKYTTVCRLNNHNKTLWGIKQITEHKNFL